MTSTLKYRSPPRASSLKRAARKAWYFGGARYCNVCESSVRVFKHYGHVRRLDARCPVCGCVERHRLTWRYFVEHTDLFDGRPKKMLHVAPEPGFEQKLRRVESLSYLSVDAQDERVDMKVDIHHLPFEDGSFDIIHCSHVLEHVADDRRALRELARVLSAAGWATILVPMFADRSFEDPRVTDPAERARLYGQWDHVRVYGPDFIERVEEAGFSVERVTATDLLPDELERKRQGFGSEQLFLCRPAKRRDFAAAPDERS